MRTFVRIFYSGADEIDAVFAQQVAVRIAAFAQPALLDVDLLEPQGLLPSFPVLGSSIWILSGALLSKPTVTRAILRGTSQRNLPGFRVFLICKGVDDTWIRESHPEFEPLLDDVMVAAESSLNDLLVELREYRCPGWGRLILRYACFGLWGLAKWCAQLAQAVHRAGFFAPFLIFFMSLVWGQRDIEPILIWMTGFTLGFSLNELDCFDLCFELGSAWKVMEPEHGLADCSYYYDGALPLQGQSQYCTSQQLACIGCAWLKRAHWTLGVRGLVGVWLVLPAFRLFRSHPLSVWIAWALCLLGGVAFGPIRYWVYRCYRQFVFLESALTRTETDRMAQFIADHPNEEPGYGNNQYLHTYGIRGWRARPDYVFVSYAWRDSLSITAASDLVPVLSHLGVKTFQDVRDIRSRFAAWRCQVVKPLIDCTHIFFVLGPDVLASRTIHIELKTALYRHHVELLPSIVCVADAETAAALLARQELSNELRFVLENCPRITRAESTDPLVLMHILRQRRRQTLWESWKATLAPRSTLNRLQEEEVTSSRPLLEDASKEH